VLSDTLELVASITQQVEAGVIQAQNMIQGLESQIASQISSVTGGLQTTAVQITAQVASVPGCATAQTTSAANVVTQAGMLLHRMY